MMGALAAPQEEATQGPATALGARGLVVALALVARQAPELVDADLDLVVAAHAFGSFTKIICGTSTRGSPRGLPLLRVVYWLIRW